VAEPDEAEAAVMEKVSIVESSHKSRKRALR
jgi:hypothetical protein